MLNEVVLMGRLTKDPELRKTGNDVSVVSFRIAVDRNTKSQDAGKPATDFIDCVAWRHNADFIQRYFQKGRMIVVRGALRQREFTTKEGDKRQVIEVEVNEQFFGDSKKSDNSGSYAPAAESTYSNREFAPVEDDDGQLPF